MKVARNFKEDHKNNSRWLLKIKLNKREKLEFFSASMFNFYSFGQLIFA